jgi:hypothetical protein
MGIAMVMEINEEVTVAAGETVAIKAVIRVAIKVRVGIRATAVSQKIVFAGDVRLRLRFRAFD